MHCIINKCAVGDMYTRPWSGGRARSGRESEGERARAIYWTTGAIDWRLRADYFLSISDGISFYCRRCRRIGAGVVPGL